jgi:hypothetical protein
LGGLESGQAEHRRPGQRRDEHIDHESVQVEERHHIECEGGAVESEGRADAERADPHGGMGERDHLGRREIGGRSEDDEGDRAEMREIRRRSGGEGGDQREMIRGR